ncbi:Sec-independent protein translocase TatB [Microbacterium sp. NPDC056569]|uniref:Sec-independent protein translocase TatB n=1 Tax=Microbacterium sp. NPDC056569 TaxID=3345867 RepID=UPI003671EC0F
MTLGLTLEKLILIAFIAAMFIGPARLPVYAAALARAVRRAKAYARDMSGRVKDELGPELTEVDWRSLDPRRYDPRRIVREALWDDEASPDPRSAVGAGRPPREPAEDAGRPPKLQDVGADLLP